MFTIELDKLEAQQRALDAEPDLEFNPQCGWCGQTQQRRRRVFFCERCGVSNIVQIIRMDWRDDELDLRQPVADVEASPVPAEPGKLMPVVETLAGGR